MASTPCKKSRDGEVGLKREREASAEEGEGNAFPTDGNLHRCR
jgi:hypothetical protein